MPGTVRKEPEPCRESHAETDPGQERRLHRPSLSHALIYQVREERHAVSRQEVRWQRGSDEPRALDVQVDALAVPGDPFAGVIVTYIDATEHRAVEADLARARRELETAYDELQSTVEELETMNDELRDRTDETLQANSFLGSVLSSIQQGVVVVDRTLRIVVWSRRATDLWGLRDDVGRGRAPAQLRHRDPGAAPARPGPPRRRRVGGRRS